MITKESIQSYVVEKSVLVEHYCGAILIGSQATGYASEFSDIDIHIFIDSPSKQSRTIGDMLDNHMVSIWIYSIEHTLASIKYIAENWWNMYRRMYGVQWYILDDPYHKVESIKNIALRTSTTNEYNIDDLNITLSGFCEFRRTVYDFNPFVREKTLFYIFEQYSYYNGYDHYREFNVIFWKAAQRIFHDDVYALQHRGKIYEDKKFISIWEDVFFNYTDKGFVDMIDYVISQMTNIKNSLKNV